MLVSSPSRSSRKSLIRWAIVAACVLAPALAQAFPPSKGVEVENIRVGINEHYKIGAWTPVWVQVRGGVEPFDGIMEVISEDESGTPNAYSVIAKVGAGETAKFTAYTRPGSPRSNFSVRFIDKDGRGRGGSSVETLRPNNLPQATYADEIAILALGKTAGIDLITKVPGLNGGTQLNNTNGSATAVDVVQLSDLDVSFLPGRSMGFDGFDAIVIDTNDANVVDTVLSSRGETIREWVGQGGHLVIAVGQNWQKVKDSPLGSILPATPTGRTTITDVRTIESYANAKDPLVAETGAARAALTITKLEGAEKAGSKVLCTTTSSPIVVRGAYGFGRVTVVALDVDSKPFASWTDRGLFWVKAVDLHPASTATSNLNRSRFNQHMVSDLSGVVRQSLEQFEGVRLIPFGWVAFFIFLYIVLIGPGDYFFLRKVIKRMELTWITFPAIVILVSAAAYFAAYRMKGTELRVNEIDFVDVDIPSKAVRGSSFIGLFSPQNRDYSVSVVPRALTPGGKTPTGETRVSWFASPEEGLRGMNGGGQGLSFGGSGYQYAPLGQPSKLEGVRVKIWSTKEFTARWFANMDGEPIVDSDLSQVGTSDRLNGTVTNRLDVPLQNAVLAFNRNIYYNLGTIAPGATVRVELTQDRRLSGHMRDLQSGYTPDQQVYSPSPGANISRYKLAQAILFRESDTGTNQHTNRPLNYLDLTGQLDLDRPMLVAEVDRPFCDLDLGSVPSAPKTSRSTILRVILPLTPPPSTEKPANGGK